MSCPEHDAHSIRRQAAEVIRRFREQESTNDQFDNDFSRLRRRSSDRALKAIGSAIWCTYSDLSEHTLGRGREVAPELLAFFDRCILFLQTERPYTWERDDLGGIAGVTTVLRRLSRTVQRWRGYSPAQDGLRPGPDSPEDWTVWPFASADDLEEAKGDSSARQR